jgi:hypothetical protein
VFREVLSMWTAENRARYETAGYPSDQTNEEWVLVESHLLPSRRRRHHTAAERRRVRCVMPSGCRCRS